MIFVKTDDAVRTIQRLGITLSSSQLAVAESRAINKTLGKARTQARKEIKKVYNISQKNLNKVNFVPARANPTSIEAASGVGVWGKLYADRKPLPLDAFSPKQETGSGSTRITKRGAQKITIFKKAKPNPTAGVSIEIFKGKRVVIPFAFMIPGGAVRVFARGMYKNGTDYGFVERHVRVNNTGSDTPVKPLITVSTFGAILNERVMDAIVHRVRAEYPLELEKQLFAQLNQGL